MNAAAASTDLSARNKRVALISFATALAMLALGYAAVPLYRLFCQVTGFQGTTQRATEEQFAAVKVANGTVSVRFDANIDRKLPWSFTPEKITDTARLGERRMAVYLARNNSDRPIVGRATYNVEPEVAGKYFNKIQCFCFTEQTLMPGQEVRMPVIYYVDPAISKDEDAKDLEQITLSYTFYEDAAASAKALDPAKKPS